MWQAEIGNPKVNSSGRYPDRGDVIGDFTLPSTHGNKASPYDYRGRSNLVLLFAGDGDQGEQRTLYSTLIAHYLAIREQEAEVLVVVPGSVESEHANSQPEPPFPVLLDSDLRIHKAVGAVSVQGKPVPALYVTDRYMEVYAAWRSAEGDTLPRISDVLSWLAYINSECPECTQIEWPKDD